MKNDYLFDGAAVGTGLKVSKNKTEKISPKPVKAEKKKKEKQPETEQQRKRKLIIKIIAAVAAFAAAAAAFATGITSYMHRDPGFYHIDTDPVADAMLYQKELMLTCYFDGKSTEIRTAMTETRREYSAALSHIYKLLDHQNTYNGYVNIAYINAHRGEEIELDPVLYDILMRAKELTSEGCFNMFAGALNKEWNSVLTLADAADYDPKANDNEAERISAIAEKTADISNFSLETVSEAERKVIFTVSQDYLDFIENYELSKNVIDLGFLKTAFEIEYTAGRLEEAGFTNGYLASSDGSITLALKGLGDGGVFLEYTLYENEPAQACRMKMKAGAAFSHYRTFPLEDAWGYYTVSVGSEAHLCHPHYNYQNGEVYDLLLSSSAVSYSGSAVDSAILAYRMITAPDEEGVRHAAAEAGESGMLISFITKAEPAVVNVDKAHESELIFTEGRPFAAKTL